MVENAGVAWIAVDKPWEVERELLSRLLLPLNLRDHDHPFVLELQQIRRNSKVRAMALPVVADNGGARRPLGRPGAAIWDR